MPPKTKETQPKLTYTRIGVKVEDYDARVETDISLDAKDPKFEIDLDDRRPVCKYVTRRTVIGIATDPEDRAAQRLEVTVYGDEAPSRHVIPTRKDLQERGEYGQPLYRQYRAHPLADSSPLLSRIHGDNGVYRRGTNAGMART